MTTISLARPRRAANGQAAPRRQPTRFRTSLALALLTALAGAAALLAEGPVSYGGRVLDVAGRPVVGARVELYSGPRVDGAARVGGSGSWLLTAGHRADGHQLLFSADGFLPLQVEEPPRVLVLHRSPVLKGIVVDETGGPVGQAVVVLSQPGRLTEWSWETTADGTFDLGPALRPGSYELTVSSLDHNAFHSAVRLTADSVSTISPVLARELGRVHLTSTPAGLQPLLDGQPLAGCVTPCEVSLVAGHHVISFDTDLFVPWRTELDIANRQQLPVNVTLERKTGTLSVSGPAGGDLVVDGQDMGGPTWSGRVPTGPHVVSYRTSGYWPEVSRVNVGWNQASTLALGASLTAIKGQDQAGFLAGLQAYLRSLGEGGQWGVYLEDLKSGEGFGWGQDNLLEAASDIKVPVALYLLHQIEAGGVQLTDEVTLQAADFMGGTGTLQGSANPGDKYKYWDLLNLLIQVSDNTAWRALQRALGADAIDAYAASIGAPDCHQVDDNCTAHEAGLMLSQLDRGKLLNSGDTSFLLTLLENTIYNERIPYYLGGITVAHKTGSDGSVCNDVGIVLLNGHPFILSMFTWTDDYTTGLQAIRDVARAAVDYFRS